MSFTSDMIIDSISNATPPLSTGHIPRVQGTVTDTHDYEKYYAPKFVSIGPYHFGRPKLEYVEKLKPIFTMKLFGGNKETLRSLYEKLGEPAMVRELRSFYEENSTTTFSDEVFTKMMLLDCCFILYYIQFIYGERPGDCLELKSHQIVYLHHDLFLLENQIPFKVLNVAMELIKFNWSHKITPFINDNILVSHVKPRRKWTDAIFCVRNARTIREEQKMKFIGDSEPNHLLHLLHRTLTKHQDIPEKDPPNRCTFRNVNELADVGVHFKPSDTMSLVYVKYLKRSYCWFTADVELPPISVDEFTKPMLLNLIAYEMSSDVEFAWVTSYVCLLDSLIGHPEDVEILRKAGVLEDSFGRDQEVVKLFNEIATGLIPDPSAYVEARYKIQRHYDIWKYSLISQIKHLYVKNPALFFSYFGVAALFLSVVQTYFTIWSPKGTCDDLCMFLKKNHHL